MDFGDPVKSPGSWRQPIGSQNSFRRPPIASMSYDQLAALAHQEAPLDPDPDSSGTDSEIDDLTPFESNMPDFNYQNAKEVDRCKGCGTALAFENESILPNHCEECVCVGVEEIGHAPHILSGPGTVTGIGRLCNLEVPLSVVAKSMAQATEDSDDEEMTELRLRLKAVSVRSQKLKKENLHLAKLSTAAEEEERGFSREYQKLKEKAAAYSAKLNGTKTESNPPGEQTSSPKRSPFRRAGGTTSAKGSPSASPSVQRHKKPEEAKQK